MVGLLYRATFPSGHAAFAEGNSLFWFPLPHCYKWVWQCCIAQNLEVDLGRYFFSGGHVLPTLCVFFWWSRSNILQLFWKVIQIDTHTTFSTMWFNKLSRNCYYGFKNTSYIRVLLSTYSRVSGLKKTGRVLQVILICVSMKENFLQILEYKMSVCCNNEFIYGLMPSFLSLNKDFPYSPGYNHIH